MQLPPEEVRHACLDLAISLCNNVKRERNYALIIRPRSKLLHRQIAKSRHACRTSSELPPFAHFIWEMPN